MVDAACYRLHILESQASVLTVQSMFVEAKERVHVLISDRRVSLATDYTCSLSAI